MKETINNRLKDINIENNIWIIYLIVIGLSYYANDLEKNYFLTGNNESKEKYRKINAFIFIILIIVYSYFEKDSIDTLKNNKNNKLYQLSLIGSTAVLISGIIFLYIIIKDKNIDAEIAFN